MRLDPLIGHFLFFSPTEGRIDPPWEAEERNRMLLPRTQRLLALVGAPLLRVLLPLLAPLPLLLAVTRNASLVRA